MKPVYPNRHGRRCCRDPDLPRFRGKRAAGTVAISALRERTRAGLDVARARGRKGGRRPLMTESKKKTARKLLAGGALPRAVAEDLGVSVATLYRWVPGGKSVAQ